MESCRDLSNCRISLMRKLKGIPLRDSAPNGSSECFSESAIPVDDIPDGVREGGREGGRKRGMEGGRVDGRS